MNLTQLQIAELHAGSVTPKGYVNEPDIIQDRREEQLRKACEKAVRTGRKKDLAEYLKMRRE